MLKGYPEHLARLQEAGWTQRELDLDAMRFTEGMAVYKPGAQRPRRSPTGRRAARALQGQGGARMMAREVESSR